MLVCAVLSSGLEKSAADAASVLAQLQREAADKGSAQAEEHARELAMVDEHVRRCVPLSCLLHVQYTRKAAVGWTWPDHSTEEHIYV